MPTAIAYGLLALAVLAGLGGIYGAGYRSGSNAVHNEWQTASREQRDRELLAGQKAAEKKEQGDAKARVVYRTITKTVDRLVERPSYRNECLDPDGLRIARDAIRGEVSDTTKPDESVRPPARTERRDGGIVIALDRGRF